jgi:hypothetical protein
VYQRYSCCNYPLVANQCTLFDIQISEMSLVGKLNHANQLNGIIQNTPSHNKSKLKSVNIQFCLNNQWEWSSHVNVNVLKSRKF